MIKLYSQDNYPVPTFPSRIREAFFVSPPTTTFCSKFLLQNSEHWVTVICMKIFLTECELFKERHKSLYFSAEHIIIANTYLGLSLTVAATYVVNIFNLHGSLMRYIITPSL